MLPILIHDNKKHPAFIHMLTISIHDNKKLACKFWRWKKIDTPVFRRTLYLAARTDGFRFWVVADHLSVQNTRLQLSVEAVADGGSEVTGTRVTSVHMRVLESSETQHWPANIRYRLRSILFTSFIR